MSDLASFLSTVSLFQELTPAELEEVASLCREDRHEAGSVILHQGQQSDAVYFLRSGRLAVRVDRPEGRETVAYVEPPGIFGELSYITGRPCSADVEVMVDATVVAVTKDAAARLPKQREHILRGMMTILAERLHDTVAGGAKVPERPVVLLKNGSGWEGSWSFASEMGTSVARQTGKETLIVHFTSSSTDKEMKSLGPKAFSMEYGPQAQGDGLRQEVADQLAQWQQRFTFVILNPVEGRQSALLESIDPFADYRGVLLGPGEPCPSTDSPKDFVVQDASSPTLPVLSGSRQLIWGVAQSESAYHAGEATDPRFRRTVDSMARFVSNLQVGIALGGGAAWGWAHIGVLETLEQAGLPLDMVSGCSMGSVIGTLRCSGRDTEELCEIARYWQGRTRRFIEPRIWKLHLIREKVVRRTFSRYFGNRQINQMEIPFWANAVDIKTGKEYTIKDGSIVDAVRASIALPGLLPPIERSGHLLLDAGVLDPVPVNLVRSMGSRYALGINAMAPLEAQEVSTSYPLNMFDVMFRAMRITGHEIGQARLEAAADIALTPQLGNISMLAFEQSDEIIEAGRKVAKENLPIILAGYQRLSGGRPPS